MTIKILLLGSWSPNRGKCLLRFAAERITEIKARQLLPEAFKNRLESR